MNDPTLELIVKFSEMDEPLETPITLITAGFLVSGFIISKDKYMQENELTRQIEAAFQKAKAALNEEEPEDDGVRRFIHLRDARYFTPGQAPTPTEGAVTCRIRLAHVAGFHLGYLSTRPEG